MSRISQSTVALAVPADIRHLLESNGRSVAEITTVIDGQPALDVAAIEKLRAGVEALGLPAGYGLSLDELEDVDGDEEPTGPQGDERDIEDFDFGSLVRTMDLLDVEGCYAALDRERAPYVRAARRAGKKNPSGDFYNVANYPLFDLRRTLQAELSQLDAVELEDRDVTHMVKTRRARRDLESLTDLIVRFNYGMTITYVSRFTSNTSREDSDDFQSAAVLGLMNSIDTFDPDKGRFGSWAYKRIQREVLRAVREADFANMNHGDFEKRPDILRAYAQLAGPEENRRVPSFPEVAAAAGVTVELVARVLNAPHLESLHVHVGEEGDTELGDLIPDRGESVDSQVIGQMDVAALMTYGMTALDAREQFVIVRRYGLDGEPSQCLSSIGKQLRLSREAVRQIEAKGLAKILHPATLRRIVRQGRA